MNKDHIVHLSGALDRGSSQSLIDIFETLNEYEWVQIGGAIKHPEKGKIVDMS